MLIIGIDIDGVIGDSDSYFRKNMELRFNREFPRSAMKKFIYEECFDIDTKQMSSFWQDFDRENLWKHIPLIDGAKDVISGLYHSHKVIIVTARPVHLKHTTVNWLAEHAIPYHDILFMGQASKHEVAADRGYLFNFFIEDHPEYALDMAKNGTKVLLMSYPWNQMLPCHPNIQRVHSWEQIKVLVSENLCEV